MLANSLLAIVMVLVGEIILIPVFKMINSYFLGKNSSLSGVSIIKGVLERIFIFVGLINGIPLVLVLLGALKVGTRLEGSSREKVSNDYFLTGNLVSFLLGITYSIVYLDYRIDILKFFAC